MLLTGASICSGIGAPEAAMPYVDWKWCAEIERFPSTVLNHHRPTVPNLGDITARGFVRTAKKYGPLDLLVAGTPCQAFSVAGQRLSLRDHRGNLTLRFVEICDAIDPRVIEWENVPGVLSTDDNAFGCLLGALAGAGSPLVPAKGQRWTDAGMVDGPRRRLAWRTFDAQYFGLAQRRERVFLVGCPRSGADPAEVLFESACLRWYPPSREEARQGVAGSLAARTSGGGGLGTDFEIGGGLQPCQR